MGLPTGGFQTYNQVGAREDLEDMIYDISPMDTVVYTRAAKSKATAVTHEWQTDALDAPADNAWIEGDDFSGGAVNPTTRLKNYTQISRKDYVITDTADTVNTAGRDRETAYQAVRKMKAWKRDVERALTRNAAATIATSASARVSAGMETWIYTEGHIHATGQGTSTTTPAPVAGVAGTAGTDGSATAFVEADLKSALGQAWSAGGDTDVILMPSNLKAKFDLFTGIATRMRDVASRAQAQIIAAADVYVSSYGSHQAVLSRYMRASAVLALDMSTWGIAWLRSPQMVNIAKTGDSTKRMIVGEWTLVAKSPTANAKLTNVT